MCLPHSQNEEEAMCWMIALGLLVTVPYLAANIMVTLDCVPPAERNWRNWILPPWLWTN
jgi:hypothetical protein